MERYRIHADGGLFFITMTVVDWLPVFVSESACRIMTESLNYCHECKGLRINAYVIMPTHVHAIVFGQEFNPSELKSTLTDLRKFTGRRLIDHCAQHLPGCFDRVFAESAPGDRDRRFWQPTLHPVQIENERFWAQKRDYLHDNPCRKGLVLRVEYWRFSSASTLLPDGPRTNDVISSPIEW